MNTPIIKRQKETPGSILEIDIEGQYFIYAQIVHTLQCVFFDFKSIHHIDDITVLNNKPVLFVASVYSYIITRGYWLKIGKLPIREEFNVMPNEFIHHSYGKVEFELYDPNTGTITPSTKEECKNLERAAVWDLNHIIDRIRDHYNGAPCIWLEGDYELFPERKPISTINDNQES